MLQIPKRSPNITALRPTRIRVTDVGEYIRYHNCDRRFKLKANGYAATKNLPERLFQSIFQSSLDPVLEEEGRRSEQKWAESLNAASFVQLTPEPLTRKPIATPWYDFTENLAELQVGEVGYGREVQISGQIGNFSISGQIDFILLLWEGDRPKLRLVEGKASRKDRTYHRIQLALYKILVCQEIRREPIFVDARPIDPEQIEAVVVRTDAASNEVQNILEVAPFDLDTFDSDLDYLLKVGGKLENILQTDLEDLDYQLNGKCSDCLLSVHCLSESARLRKLELLGISPSLVRCLEQAGIQTIDNLAQLDLHSTSARQLRQNLGFTDNLELLKTKAQARYRTLVGGDAQQQEYEVKQLPSSTPKQTLLPLRKINNQSLLRVFLSVEYDYAENRIVALCAHITNSEGKLDTKFERSPVPVVQELVELGEGNYQERPLSGADVLHYRHEGWQGDYTQDNLTEGELIRGFFAGLTNKLLEVAGEKHSPLHFYLWSRQEMSQLIEGCTRCGGALLAHLKELMGCRRELEQQIYTCLDMEVDRCYALGWTGRDLAVVTNLRWFAYKYHWCREINGETVFLDRQGAFWRDIFDFVQYGWELDPQGQWVEASDRVRYPLEIKLRYFNSTSVAYWHGYWGILPDLNDPDLNPTAKKAIADYNQAAQPGYLEEYLRARTHALRWIEERFPDWLLNEEIEKPLVNLEELQNFSLEVNTTSQACLDFLRLDHHIKKTDWLSEHFNPPLYRLAKGKTLILKNVILSTSNKQKYLRATIDFEGCDLTREVIATNCTLEEGSFVRLSPCPEDLQRGQSLKQLTKGVGFNCIIHSLDWDNGVITLEVVNARQGYYILPTSGTKQTEVLFPTATLDESPSDFVANRVDPHLHAHHQSFINQWLDPANPQIPPLETISEIQPYCDFLETLSIDGYPLHRQQKEAILQGLNSRVQLLLGPPGTGKTNTTAIAIFLRILARHRVGDIILVAASTHTAVDEIMLRISKYLPLLYPHAQQHQLPRIPLRLGRLDPRDESRPNFAQTPVQLLDARTCSPEVERLRQDCVVVLGGTVTGLLKLAKDGNFLASTLIVDEASMMVFANFLALATLIHQDGQILLAGDHRQLAPIVAHNWEKEDRPPVVQYQPFVSAYQAIAQLQPRGLPNSALASSALTYTFRLPPAIRHLIARLYRRWDGIELEGKEVNRESNPVPCSNSWSAIWEGSHSLLLVVHSESDSQKSNPLEVAIIQEILRHAPNLEENSVAIITPHRAQRTQLKTSLEDYATPIRVIDTVEKLQGGECETIIVSATASDPLAIAQNVEFILDLNRSNVAFSRVKERLVVVCAASLLNFIPADLEQYEKTLLWKALRSLCTQPLVELSIAGHTAEILTINKEVEL